MTQLRDVRAHGASLGAAVPVRLGERSAVAAFMGKPAAEMKAEHQAWLDEQPTSTSCFFCDWRMEGTAAECREAASAHREQAHPDAANRLGRRRARMAPKGQRSEAENAQAAREAAEARRVRAEREDAERLAKIERGRQRDALEAMDAGEPQDREEEQRPTPHAEQPEPQPDDSPPPRDATDTEGTTMTDTNGRQPRGAFQRDILGALLAGHTTPAAIGAALSRDPKLVSATLTTLIKKRYATRVSYGTYDSTDEGARAYATGQPLDTGRSEREPQARAEEPATPLPANASDPPAAEEPSRSEPEPSSAELAVVAARLRDPIRSADIPYDAEILEDEASFLRERADALEQIAAGVRALARASRRDVDEPAEALAA